MEAGWPAGFPLGWRDGVPFDIVDEKPGLVTMTPSDDRRRHPRMAFPPMRRPRLLLPLGGEDIVDASLGGFKVLHRSPIPFQVGSRLQGTLQWLNGEPHLPLSGTVVRAEQGWFALQCDPGFIPPGYMPWSAPR